MLRHFLLPSSTQRRSLVGVDVEVAVGDCLADGGLTMLSLLLLLLLLLLIALLERAGALLNVEVWDWDRSSADDPLGHFQVKIGEELLSQEVRDRLTPTCIAAAAAAAAAACGRGCHRHSFRPSSPLRSTKGMTPPPSPLSPPSPPPQIRSTL